jgi:hypothetical protein
MIKKNLKTGKRAPELKRGKPVLVQRVVTPQPDRDFESLKACCKALDACSCRKMVDATLAFLNSKYAWPGAV